MTKFYFLIPLVLLAAFTFVYRGAETRRIERDNVHRAKAAAAKAEKEAARRIAETRTANEIRARTAARENDETMRAGKKLREHTAAVDGFNEAAAKYEAAGRTFATEAGTLEARIAELRAVRETSERETFALAQSVERQRVERRATDLEIQRTSHMVATRLTESAWANPPPSPAPKTR